MTNLNAMTTDLLLDRAWTLDVMKELGLVGLMSLTQSGIDQINQELVEIDTELELRQPTNEYRTLYGRLIGGRDYWTSEEWFDLEIVGFEYLGTCSCGRAQKDCTFPYCEA